MIKLIDYLLTLFHFCRGTKNLLLVSGHVFVNKFTSVSLGTNLREF